MRGWHTLIPKLTFAPRLWHVSRVAGGCGAVVFREEEATAGGANSITKIKPFCTMARQELVRHRLRCADPTVGTVSVDLVMFVRTIPRMSEGKPGHNDPQPPGQLKPCDRAIPFKPQLSCSDQGTLL